MLLGNYCMLKEEEKDPRLRKWVLTSNIHIQCNKEKTPPPFETTIGNSPKVFATRQKEVNTMSEW